ncbi:MAG: 2-hydroxychromene-2-carboxylate isomerase [Pseudomonadota bacterium]|nr:2-hydroxychromene-2-carboxylate isomerase [Pseudomonadota bacterium]HBP15287.1 2-hydroxychromene-2-carboxylate isomerase [Gammaproteobacteria bacterium]|tara:strand:+ start:482 stop:1081 length:600 start_codon:yes stop_codon:yes gene_type:complete
MKIEFFWDIGSTNTYFALHLIRPIVARYGAELVMHPFNLGYVFRHHQYVLAEEPQAKLQNRGRDLRRWAEKYRLGFRMPDTFPIKTSRALRGALVAREFDREGAYIDRLFTRYWEENDASISEYEGIASLAKEIEIDPDLFITRCEDDEIKRQLINMTQNALDRGVFGAPSFYIGDELYWGKDRMDFIEDALQKGDEAR